MGRDFGLFTRRRKGQTPFSAPDLFVLDVTLFALGFRPLYLLAGGYAALSVAAWALQYAGRVPGGNVLWHAHEMLFGYAFAVIAGFLLTAVRVWTQRDTPTGGALAGIAVLWLGARVVAPFSLFYAAILDMLFALAVAWGIGQPLVASGNRRNWFFIALVLALGAGSLAFQRWPQLAFAGDHETRIRDLADNELRGLDQVTLTLVWHERGDVAHDRGMMRQPEILVNLGHGRRVDAVEVDALVYCHRA